MKHHFPLLNKPSHKPFLLLHNNPSQTHSASQQILPQTLTQKVSFTPPSENSRLYRNETGKKKETKRKQFNEWAKLTQNQYLARLRPSQSLSLPVLNSVPKYRDK